MIEAHSVDKSCGNVLLSELRKTSVRTIHGDKKQRPILHPIWNIVVKAFA